MPTLFCFRCLFTVTLDRLNQMKDEEEEEDEEEQHTHQVVK